jgi:hypothetical protein
MRKVLLVIFLSLFLVNAAVIPFTASVSSEENVYTAAETKANGGDSTKVIKITFTTAAKVIYTRDMEDKLNTTILLYKEGDNYYATSRNSGGSNVFLSQIAPPYGYFSEGTNGKVGYEIGIDSGFLVFKVINEVDENEKVKAQIHLEGGYVDRFAQTSAGTVDASGLIYSNYTLEEENIGTRTSSYTTKFGAVIKGNIEEDLRLSNSFEIEIPDTPSCVVDSNCGGTTPNCDSSSNTCFNCTVSDLCGIDAPVCDFDLGECGGCTRGTQCKAKYAQNPYCVLDDQSDGFGGCSKCLSNFHCENPSPYCNTDTLSCETCSLDSHCTVGTKNVCETQEGSCVECIENDLSSPDRSSACIAVYSDEKPVCNTETNTCVECLSNPNCENPEPKCDLSSKSCVPCTGATDCNEYKNNCVGAGSSSYFAGYCSDCFSDSDCISNPEGDVCKTSIGMCVECTSDSDCSGDTPYCDDRNGACVGCKEDSDCAEDRFCDNASTERSNLCVECITGSDCDGDEVCDTSNEPYLCRMCTQNSHCDDPYPSCKLADPESPEYGTCMSCTQDSDCTIYVDGVDDIERTCNTDTGLCEECDGSGEDAQCVSNHGDYTEDGSHKPYCVENECKSCVVGYTCESGICDTDKGFCVDCLSGIDCPLGICMEDGKCLECISSAECNNPTPICRDGICEGCETTQECENLGYVGACNPIQGFCLECISDDDCFGRSCTGDGICVDCEEDSDCDSGACDTENNVCVACKIDSHCSGQKDKCKTESFSCVECLLDSDCSSGQKCCNNNCKLTCGVCGDSTCSPGECALECDSDELDCTIDDCSGDGVCEPWVGETCEEEADCDCGSYECNPQSQSADSSGCIIFVCGDLECHPEECASGCDDDCSISDCSGNGNCDLEMGEDCLTSPSDCACQSGFSCDPADSDSDDMGCVNPAECGNGSCEATEDCSSCSSDCACEIGYVCTSGECVEVTCPVGDNCSSNPSACLCDEDEECSPDNPASDFIGCVEKKEEEEETETLCGNGVCDPGEETSCIIDCVDSVECGDGICDAGEVNCCEDCSCKFSFGTDKKEEEFTDAFVETASVKIENTGNTDQLFDILVDSPIRVSYLKQVLVKAGEEKEVQIKVLEKKSGNHDLTIDVTPRGGETESKSIKIKVDSKDSNASETEKEDGGSSSNTMMMLAVIGVIIFVVIGGAGAYIFLVVNKPPASMKESPYAPKNSQVQRYSKQMYGNQMIGGASPYEKNMRAPQNPTHVQNMAQGQSPYQNIDYNAYYRQYYTQMKAQGYSDEQINQYFTQWKKQQGG